MNKHSSRIQQSKNAIRQISGFNDAGSAKGRVYRIQSKQAAASARVDLEAAGAALLDRKKSNQRLALSPAQKLDGSWSGTRGASGAKRPVFLSPDNLAVRSRVNPPVDRSPGLNYRLEGYRPSIPFQGPNSPYAKDSPTKRSLASSKAGFFRDGEAPTKHKLEVQVNQSNSSFRAPFVLTPSATNLNAKHGQFLSPRITVLSRRDSARPALVLGRSDAALEEPNRYVRTGAPAKPNPFFDMKKDSKSRESTSPEVKYQIKWSFPAWPSLENEIVSEGREIGKGTFALVYRGRDLRQNKPVAIKCLDKRYLMKNGFEKMIERELDIIQRISHPGICQFYRLVESANHVGPLTDQIYFVQELCGPSTLSQFCRKHEKKRLSDDEAYCVFAQVLYAVQYLHLEGIAHRDLKLTNILIDESRTVKLIDFGFASSAATWTKEFCGTPSYMSPEIVQKKEYLGAWVDVWALGVILYKLLTGEYAFGSTPG